VPTTPSWSAADPAGRIFVNGTVAVNGATPAIANTGLIQVFGQGGTGTRH
jgi:hypothetical protein